VGDSVDRVHPFCGRRLPHDRKPSFEASVPAAGLASLNFQRSRNTVHHLIRSAERLVLTSPIVGNLSVSNVGHG
jgi:hypothetical protein